MLLDFSTDAVQPGDAASFWEDCLKRAFHLEDVVARPIPGEAFAASLKCHVLDDGFRIGDFSMSAGKLIFREDPAKDFLVVGFPVAGGEIIRHGRKSYTYAPGEVLVLNDLTHKQSEVVSDGIRRLLIGVPRRALELRTGQVHDRAYGGVHILPPGPEIDTLSRAAHILARRVEESGGARTPGVTLATAAFVERLQELMPDMRPGRGDARAKLRSFHRERIKSYALANLHNVLHIGSIAAAINLSESYVYNLFSAESLSLMRWVWLQRLERCRHELENGEPGRSIRDIAYAWGFNDAAHFSHMFHEQYGAPPREYRTQHQRARQSAPE